MPDLLVKTSRGLYCEAGDFYIDPWRPVPRAVVTHGHSDHASWGHEHYLCTRDSVPILRRRLGEGINVEGEEYGVARDFNGVRVSFHPAGHILGSAQVLVEHHGERWVVTGDYKTEPEATCAPFELVRCHTLITETTFGLPIYRWAPQQQVYEAMNAWWAANQAAGKATLITGYSLGKAQRILAGLDPSLGPIVVHGAVAAMNECYRAAGVALPKTHFASELSRDELSRAVVVAPPSALGSPWLRRFGDIATGFASGWMMVRGARRQKAVDQGFVLSDHVDWPSLMAVIEASGAERVLTTHGAADTVSRYLTERGLDSQPLDTPFVGEALSPAAEEDEGAD